MNIVFIYEDFSAPFDEGVKNFAYMVHKTLCENHNVSLVRDIKILPRILNSILLLPRIFLIAGFSAERIVFVPKGALTFTAWVKAWVLSITYGSTLSIIDVQRRELSGWQQYLARKMKLARVFSMSSPMVNDLANLGVRSSVIISGIDRKRFAPTGNKKELRVKYSIPKDKRVVLHVGHVRESRNVGWLKQIQQHVSDIQVVLIGSTTTEQDDNVFDDLRNAGVIIYRESIDEIQELYQLADCYCFPILKKDAAMETPLSIFEAMAANLPVITTRFGLLPEIFDEDPYFRYVDSVDEMLQELNQEFVGICNNRKKTEPFTWQATVEQLIGIYPR
ncbi:MAG: glycosyltransferase family 4 protein [Gammaproteobacteria bacterium]|nr:glycosyltransferase family 4 protein [Gammaproteobacteria bacterium]